MMTMFRSVRSHIDRFRNADEGAALIEFAMILPLLILMYFGAFEGSKLYEVSRKAGSATETIGDLVGRTRSVSTAELDKIIEIARSILVPFDENQLKVQITGVSIDQNGKGTVSWSRKKGANGAPNAVGLPKGGTYPVDQTLVQSGIDFFIMVETTYSYTSPVVHSVIASNLDIDKNYAIVPRLSATVPCTDCG